MKLSKLGVNSGPNRQLFSWDWGHMPNINRLKGEWKIKPWRWSENLLFKKFVPERMERGKTSHLEEHGG